MTQGESKPSCAKCKHYFITHDVQFPYGCRAMNFKSQRSPHSEITAATGAACVAFEPRADAGRRSCDTNRYT